MIMDLVVTWDRDWYLGDDDTIEMFPEWLDNAAPLLPWWMA